ncbi:MAG: HlyD family efflux transporter periplasmic adaptor subunit [Lunatimonas sp.]|uniref:HlyD family secretion protein n=1 Tax=Lunatimonas sp. TaxID=2060141 RepID=UPI00263B3354|nr:HlyD family efflux transporter periplasmic adaptor subunit [Lunatimonas sp.]MCC5936686.1 HlyD family efflux transporter periplasmic adaptor subunit [Lunatimonas sp.]
MSYQKIFPATVVNHSIEVYESRISVKSNIIYLILLGTFISMMVALPFIFVDVAVLSRGTLQSALQRNTLTSSVAGRLEKWNVYENQKVRKGDILAVVRSEQVQLEIKGIKERLNLIDDFMSDLRSLLLSHKNETSTPLLDLKSKFYQASFLEFEAKVSNQTATLEKLTRDYERAKILFESESVAFAEFDNVEVQYKQALTQLAMLEKHQVNLWGQDLVNYQNESIRLKSQLEVLTEQMDQFKIIAGTNGTLINVQNLNEGDFVHPQQKLAEISPDTTIIAVTYISPIDIAFIDTEQEVSFQIDAYNYNQWGVAKGKVIDIADDLTVLNEREAGYLVTCLLDAPYLTLPSGQSGYIKKGMTFNARFVIARRSLFQLLYDKVNNWINPQVQLPSKLFSSWESR